MPFIQFEPSNLPFDIFLFYFYFLPWTTPAETLDYLSTFFYGFENFRTLYVSTLFLQRCDVSLGYIYHIVPFLMLSKQQLEKSLTSEMLSSNGT